MKSIASSADEIDTMGKIGPKISLIKDYGLKEEY